MNLFCFITLTTIKRIRCHIFGASDSCYIIFIFLYIYISKPCSHFKAEPPPKLAEVYQCVHFVHLLFRDKVILFLYIYKQIARKVYQSATIINKHRPQPLSGNIYFCLHALYLLVIHESKQLLNFGTAHGNVSIILMYIYAAHIFAG